MVYDFNDLAQEDAKPLMAELSVINLRPDNRLKLIHFLRTLASDLESRKPADLPAKLKATL